MANASRPQSPSLLQLKYLSSFILPPQKVHFHLLNGTQWQTASCWWVIWTKWTMRETVGRKISCVLDSVNHALWFVQSKGLTEENTPLHTHCMKAKKQYHGWKSTLHKKRRSESVLQVTKWNCGNKPNSRPPCLPVICDDVQDKNDIEDKVCNIIKCEARQ